MRFFWYFFNLVCPLWFRTTNLANPRRRWDDIDREFYLDGAGDA